VLVKDLDITPRYISVDNRKGNATIVVRIIDIRLNGHYIIRESLPCGSAGEVFEKARR
jgi:hypothetical protein